MFSLSFVACDDDSKGEEQPVPVTFELTVSDIGTNGATVSVTPSDVNATYVFEVVEKSLFEELGTPAAVAEKVVEDLKKYQTENGATLADTLSQGNASHIYAKVLKASTEYSACAFGVDASGKLTSEVFTKDFTTEELPPMVIEGWGSAKASFFGTDKGTVNGLWKIELTSADYMGMMTLVLSSPVDQSATPAGEYEISDSYDAVGTAQPGYLNGYDFEGCSYADFNTSPATSAFMKGGTIKVEDLGDENYKIVVNATDEAGRSIQTTYEGYMFVMDYTEDWE